MFGIVEGVLAVVFLFVEVLDVESGEQALGLGPRLVGAIGNVRPIVTVAEELTGEAAARLDDADDGCPQCREVLGRAEGEAEAGIHEPGPGKHEALERFVPDLEAVGVRQFPLAEAAEGVGVPVDRDHTPASPEQFHGVAALTAPQIDRQRRSS